MFSKKKCKKCGNKVSESYSFCPACGTKMDSDENWGMLGRNDFFEETDPLKLFGGGMLGKMLTSAMRMLEKEMQTEMKQQRETPGTDWPGLTPEPGLPAVPPPGVAGIWGILGGSGILIPSPTAK